MTMDIITYSKVSKVEREVQKKPDISYTDADTGTFDIADNNGKVAVRCQNGHILTKEFYSDYAGIVKGSNSSSSLDIADNNGYVILRLKNGHVQTKNFNSVDAFKPVEYKFSGNDLLIGYSYNNTHDAVVVFNVGRANDLLDFSAFKLKTKGESLEGLETSDLTNVWLSGTDMHGPFQFNATTNPDGYYSSATDPSFTGGNHTVSINGNNVKSASSKYVHYFADGKPVSSGYGRCNQFEIKWANNVQAYNCVKADGTGRTSLIEYHDMIFDGIRFNEEIMLMPTEEITMGLWYGLQSVSWGATYTNVRFIDGSNRGVYTPSDSDIKSGNSTTSGIVQTGEVHSMETRIDTTVDLGKRTYYSGTKGAFMSNSAYKSYFNIINGKTVTMGEWEGYFLRGSYRFYPTVS